MTNKIENKKYKSGKEELNRILCYNKICATTD